jgi:hypothetical protein
MSTHFLIAAGSSSARLLLFTAALACLSLSSAQARLGESQAASRSRYGAPVEGESEEPPLLPGAVEKVYSFNGFRIRAAFLNDVTVRIAYTRAKEEGVPITKGIEQAEIDAILDAEKGKSRWKEDAARRPNPLEKLEQAAKAAFGGRSWERGDNKATAKILQLNQGILIDTKEAVAWAEKQAKLQKEKPAIVPKF